MFFLLFCLMIEGSGKPKNIWILRIWIWIRIRIRNTALKALPQKGQLNSLEVNSCTLRTCLRSAYIAELYKIFEEKNLSHILWESENMILDHLLQK